VIKFRRAFANTVVLFLMMVSVSAFLAVFFHSIMYMPAWVSIVLGSFILLFITMITLEYSEEKNDD